MSTEHVTGTGAPGDDPWAPVPASDDPWADVAAGDDAWSSGDAREAWTADESGSAWSSGAVQEDSPDRWSSSAGAGSDRADAWGDAGSRGGDRGGRSATAGRARSARFSETGPGEVTAGDAPERRTAVSRRRAVGTPAGPGAAERSVGPVSRTARGADAPVSLADLAAVLTPASALARPADDRSGAADSGDRTDELPDGRTARQERIARMLAERAARSEAPEGAEPALSDPAVSDPALSHLAPSGPALSHPAPSDPALSDPSPRTAVDQRAADELDRPTRSGAPARPRRGGRRAPATEPPDRGSAAVDVEPDQESVARTIVLRQLTAAPRSRHQLSEALAKRDVPADVADRVLDRFTEVGLIDDAAYAEMLVRSRHSERGLSRRALALELRRKGVSPEDSEVALDQVDDEDEEQAARALARKKLRSTRGLEREVRLRRAYGALGRKGYGGALVSKVVREELAAEEDGAADA
jgi:SOS response regulatory protein OraA/RecX